MMVVGIRKQTHQRREAPACDRVGRSPVSASLLSRGISQLYRYATERNCVQSRELLDNDVI